MLLQRVDSEITFRTATEEEAHCVRELIESAGKTQAENSKIMEINREDAQKKIASVLGQTKTVMDRKKNRHGLESIPKNAKSTQFPRGIVLQRN